MRSVEVTPHWKGDIWVNGHKRKIDEEAKDTTELLADLYAILQEYNWLLMDTGRE